MGRLLKNLLIYLVIVVFAVLAIKLFVPATPSTTTWNYNQFLTALTAGNIKSISLKSEDTSYHVDGTTTNNENFNTDIPVQQPGFTDRCWMTTPNPARQP